MFCSDIDLAGIVLTRINGYDIVTTQKKFHVRDHGFYSYVNAPTRKDAEDFARRQPEATTPTPDGTMVPCGYCGEPYPYKRGDKPVCASCYVGR